MDTKCSRPPLDERVRQGRAYQEKRLAGPVLEQPPVKKPNAKVQKNPSAYK